MKITDIVTESTTSGAIATVAQPMTTQKRSGVGKGVYGNEKPGNLLTGKKTNKKYANSKVNESKMKELAMDLKDMDNGNFQKKYKKSKEQIKMLLGDPQAKKPTVHEAHLEEDDLILVPGQGHRLKTGFHAFDPDKAEHEGETLKNSLRTIARNAKELHNRLENSDQFPEWVSEKIGTIKGMMVAVTEYLISKQEPTESAGVIAGGGVGESQEHFDHEISMAKGEMRSAAKSAKKIYQMLDQRDELMAWQQSYITLASDYLDSVADSMEEEMHSSIEEGIVDKIKGVIRREKAKGLPLAQTRRDYAMDKAGEAYNKGELRKGNQYNAWAERDRKKHGDPTDNPAGTYRTKTSDYTNEAQSMGTALKNTLAKAEPGSKLDNSIKRHNANIKAGQAGTLKNAPEGYHFDKKGYCRLGDK